MDNFQMLSEKIRKFLLKKKNKPRLYDILAKVKLWGRKLIRLCQGQENFKSS